MISLIIGTQWGDEGKGKIVDLLAARSNFVVRFHGGNNAGHTVIVNGKKHSFHLVPAGILNPKVTGVIANGVILDLEVFVHELKQLEKIKIDYQKKIVISPRCHLIMPYHKALDEAYENARHKHKLGTTKRGIGPAYADKVSYNGIRIYELLHWNIFQEKFTFQAKIKNQILKLFRVKPINIKKELMKFKKYRQVIAPIVKDTYSLLKQAVKKDKSILLEGAHGVMLDIDWSPYPYTTGSNVVTGAVNIGSGININKIDEIWGVVKAYTTRVGGGPLPTEVDDKLADRLRQKGQEFGTTTGRSRRIAWLDLEAVKFACQVNGLTHLAVTKIDILSRVDQIKVCVSYKLGGKKISYSECGYKELAELKPVYKTFPGWEEDTQNIKKFEDLPRNCQKYLKFIENFLKVPIKIISTGPDREAYIRI